MKILINELQYRLLIEADINFHLGNIKDVNDVKPYLSDNIYVMHMRDTGHFGSGLYFSTFNCREKRQDIQKYADEYDFRPKLQNVEQGVYRVDFDIYKNLYRVESDKHGDSLFKTLRMANRLFYGNIDVMTGKGDFVMNDSLSTVYLILKHNLSALGLKLPNYREFIKMLIKSSDDYKNEKNDNRASFSTRIMEYNGFNGVNVSNIPKYDNTTHGSVIYDISKLSDKPIPVDVDMFCKYDDKSGVISKGYSDYDSILLKGEIPLEIEKVQREKLVMFLKRYVGFLDRYTVKNLDNKSKEIYYRTLRKNLINGHIKSIEIENIKDLNPLIDDNRFEIIMDINCKINNRTILEYIFGRHYYFSDEDIEKIKNNINRELTPEEKEWLKEINS